MARARRERPRVPSHEYHGADGAVIVLRGTLSPPTRASYARIASGEDLPPAAAREDAWQRAVEFLFERLAVSWTIAGLEPLSGQRELLARFRVASAGERAWLRECLREHCASKFPELQAP